MSLPLRGTPSNEPITARTLLDRALVMVRFTPILSIADESSGAVARFQERIRHQYPLFERDQEVLMRVEVQQSGEVSTSREDQTVWRFFDIKKLWRVSLTSQSVALEVKRDGYTEWQDFSSRVTNLINLVSELFEPSHIAAVGVRFLNTGSVEPGDDDPRDHCTSALTSITGDPELIGADMTWHFSIDEGELILRSGVVPAQRTYDPQFFEPREKRTWYLDIDVIRNEIGDYREVEISSLIRAQVMRVYAVYRWAMPERK